MLTLINTVKDEDATYTYYSCNDVVKCDGTSIWMDTNGLEVQLENITVIEDEDDCKQVTVGHNARWEIYTDKGFERAISALVGFNVCFTEQGMQEDELASLEADE